MQYGTGIVNYFNLYERLIRLFAFLSVLSVPQLLIYRYFNGYDYTKQEGFYTALSFGNMGYSGAHCGTNFVDW